MPPRNPPQPHATSNRWSPEVTERADVTAAWIEAERREGRPLGDDEVWAFVTERWQGIRTGDAELVLNVACMLAEGTDRGPTRVQVDAAVLEALRSVCDGTYASDAPGDWTLEAGPGLPMDMGEVCEKLASGIHAALQPGHVPEGPGASPPGP